MTIAIPLHGAEPWIRGIRDTVAKAPPWSRVVISDASHLDDSAARLRELYADDEWVTVVSRPGSTGWCEHANRLLEEADTEYFCWMPQDDLLHPDGYFDLMVSALDDNPERSLAFPSIYKRVTRGRFLKREIAPVRFPSPPLKLGQSPPVAEALAMLDSWNLGLAWRGVFRTRLARPLPPIDDAPDQIWTFSMALAGSLVEVPDAIYLKRFHRQSAHRRMTIEPPSRLTGLFRSEIEVRLANDPVLASTTVAEVDRLLKRRHLRRRVEPVARAWRFASNQPRVVFE